MLSGTLIKLRTPGPEDVASPAPEPESPDIPTDQILLMAIGPLFDIFAPAWNVTEQEKTMLAGAYAQVVDKYFPDIAMGPEFTAIAITGMVIAPRIGQPMREEEGAEDGDQS